MPDGINDPEYDDIVRSLNPAPAAKPSPETGPGPEPKPRLPPEEEDAFPTPPEGTPTDVGEPIDLYYDDVSSPTEQSQPEQFEPFPAPEPMNVEPVTFASVLDQPLGATPAPAEQQAPVLEPQLEQLVAEAPVPERVSASSDQPTESALPASEEPAPADEPAPEPVIQHVVPQKKARAPRRDYVKEATTKARGYVTEARDAVAKLYHSFTKPRQKQPEQSAPAPEPQSAKATKWYDRIKAPVMIALAAGMIGYALGKSETRMATLEYNGKKWYLSASAEQQVMHFMKTAAPGTIEAKLQDADEADGTQDYRITMLDKLK